MCTEAQTSDPSFVLSTDGTQGYYTVPGLIGPGMCDMNPLGGTITGGTGTAGALPCCTGVQTGPLYANLSSGDIRYRISDGKDYCDPNCLAVGDLKPKTNIMYLALAIGAVVLLVATR